MDITMCTSSTCQNREQCYRAMAKPDKYQSYADFTKLCAEKELSQKAATYDELLEMEWDSK